MFCYIYMINWLFLDEFKANTPVAIAGASPSPHRLAVARVLDELRCVGAVPASDGNGGVTGWFNRLSLHLRSVVWR